MCWSVRCPTLGQNFGAILKELPEPRRKGLNGFSRPRVKPGLHGLGPESPYPRHAGVVLQMFRVWGITPYV